MNKNGLLVCLAICLIFLLILSTKACKDEILEIEESNAHRWQKYMNEQEYEQVKIGMPYMEVVKIAGGAGKEIKKNVYEWNDELLLTQGFRLTFKDDKVTKKEIVERRGNSSR
ncbi:hypothetical protein LZ480_18960 [Solibacillus sp. MA9]|uniref:DUF3862 domain-containing protein n=1 Tax=Solibacillus palustris TaxID=2908203 RepID=A0ABS9UHX2_9BACL|nr:hypothetical protein [Solibacillus sp. MA9]MCH7323946.1 hypothetical protein [Solibacillus sp. MA9]